MRSGSDLCPPRRRLLPVAAAALLVALTSLSACRATRFPDDPAAHPLWETLQEAPDTYYFLLRTGVRSRVLGFLPESVMRRQLDGIRAHWRGIDRQETTGALVDYLRAHDLDPVAERIGVTLAANADAVPPGGIDVPLEAGALKVGLLEAYYEVHSQLD